MSAKGVFTLDTRIHFVEGYLAGTPLIAGAVECGNMTEYPMEARLDMIAAVFFRAKKAQFDGGEFTVYWDDSDIEVEPDRSSSLVAPNNDISNENQLHKFYDEEWFYTRGYCSSSATMYAESYLGESYEAFKEFPDSATSYKWDIGDNERGMWLPEFNIKDSKIPYAVNTAFTYESLCLNAESEHVFTSRERGSGAGSEVEFSAGAIFNVVFSGKIAVVKHSPDSHMLDPLNAFYIGVIAEGGNAGYYFDVIGLGLPYGIAWFSSRGRYSDAVSFEYGSISAGSYRIELTDGIYLECPVYTEDFGYGASSGYITHKVTEWWPYAKNSPAVPVWDAATGLKL